jgi:hypothetical protein
MPHSLPTVAVTAVAAIRITTVRQSRTQCVQLPQFTTSMNTLLHGHCYCSTITTIIMLLLLLQIITGLCMLGTSLLYIVAALTESGELDLGATEISSNESTAFGTFGA